MRFLRGTEKLNELHCQVVEKERNYRRHNAREYAWVNSFRRGLHSCLEANVRNQILSRMDEITARTPHHRVLADLMKFGSIGPVQGQIGFDYRKWCQHKTEHNTYGAAQHLDMRFGMTREQMPLNPMLARLLGLGFPGCL